MFTQLPPTSEAFAQLSWSEIEPWYQELTATALSEETIQPWLAQWSRISELVDETMMKQEIACTQNTANEELSRNKQRFLDEIVTHVRTRDQQIKEQLLASELVPEGFAVPLRNLRTETAIFREVNVPLLNEEQGLCTEYMNIGGEQHVIWEDKKVNISALDPVLNEHNRARREQAWRTKADRRLVDREKLNEIWVKCLKLRQQIAQNAGFENYRDYRWQQLFRFDYSPADCETFHTAVEEVIVPAASKVLEQHRQRLGVSSLRPWDTGVNSRTSAAPTPITNMDEVLDKSTRAFTAIDPHLGSYFETMIEKGLLDLEERPSKAHGGYSIPLEAIRLPFVFGVAHTLKDVVDLIFHEAGHSFHVFESRHLPYIQQRKEGFLSMEVAEVASTSMEIIAPMYLHASGLSTKEEELQIRIHQLEATITGLFPYVAQGDAFQHWVYTHIDEALDPDACDAKWAELTRRFYPDIDWSGLEAVQRSGWQNVLHYYCYPFYFIEYGLAMIGALQVLRNYQNDPESALRQYRHFLSLGATRTVPDLYAAAGAKFAFDAETLGEATRIMTNLIADLENQAATIQ